MADVSKINGYNLKDAEARQELENKQDKLVSGSNIKTINNQSILGDGNIVIQGGDADLSDYAKLSDIPTKVSQLANDKNYASESYVTNAIANAQFSGGDIDLSEYATIQYVDKEISKIEISGGSSTATAINYDLNVKAVNHRGYSKGAPENTLPAYIMSKQMGYTYVEADVSFTSDGVAVLLHDATIDRTSDGSGKISEMTYADALAYDFGSWFDVQYTGVKMPTFTEFIMLCKKLGLHPYIELKQHDSYTEEQVVQLVNEVKRCGMSGKVTWISFTLKFLRYVKNVDPSARLGYLLTLLTENAINSAKGLRTGQNEVFMDLSLTNASDELIELCINNDFPVEVWTVNDESKILNMHSYISGVTSDKLIAGKILYEDACNYMPPAYIPTTSITLNMTSLTFNNSDSQTLVATVQPSDSSDAITWKTSSASIATVTNGVVTPVSNGNCTITVTSGKYSASCNIVVALPNPCSISKNLVGCVGSNNTVLVIEGESYTETFTALEFYKLEGAEVSITMGGVDISNKYNNGVLNIETVTGDVVIDIAAKEIPSYNITRNLVGCTSSSTTSKIVEGESHTETFTVSAGYKLEGAEVSITMGGVDISSKYVNGVLTIEEVTGDIVITIAAKEIPSYNITRNLVGCVGSNIENKIVEGGSYTETFTALDFYMLDDAQVSITMGGVDISNCYDNGTLSIEAVIGDVVINITAKEIVTYSITRNLVGCTSSSIEDRVVENSSHTETFTVLEFYSTDNAQVSITMGGVDISSCYDNGTKTLTITNVTGNVIISITLEGMHTNLMVDLSLTDVTNNKIVNLGRGGATYNANILMRNSDGSYVSDETGLTLNRRTYANVDYQFNKAEPFSIVVRVALLSTNENTYQRLFRSLYDAPSLYYYHKAEPKTIECKLSGVANSTTPITTHIEDGNYGTLSTAKSFWMRYESVWSSDFHTVIITNDGTTLKYYQDGVLAASQPVEGLGANKYIGLGDNESSSKNYYAESIKFTMFRIYNCALTDEEISELNE